MQITRDARAFLRQAALMFGLLPVVHFPLKLGRALLNFVMEQPDPNQRQAKHAQQRRQQNQQSRQRPKRRAAPTRQCRWRIQQQLEIGNIGAGRSDFLLARVNASQL